jgi:hypothetical protein
MRRSKRSFEIEIREIPVERVIEIVMRRGGKKESKVFLPYPFVLEGIPPRKEVRVDSRWGTVLIEAKPSLRGWLISVRFTRWQEEGR